MGPTCEKMSMLLLVGLYTILNFPGRAGLLTDFR